MGLLEDIESKQFLGPEFVTWLWHRVETGGGSIELPEEEPVEIAFESSMTLEAESGVAQRQTLRGETPGLAPEARAALYEGKKVGSAKMKLNLGEMEYAFTLKGSTLDLTGVRIPAPKGLPFEEGVPLRLRSAERLFRVVEKLFESFLDVRLDKKSWDRELGTMRKWVEEK